MPPRPESAAHTVMSNEAPYVKRAPGAPVSLALGTMNFGKRTSREESERIIASALERGLRVFDTANVYTQGESERIVGRALASQRHDVVIATKVGLDVGVDGAREGLSRSAIRRAIDGSLARLAVEHIDVWYLHAPDHTTPIEETLDAMLDVIREGKVRAWGVSNYAAWQIVEITRLSKERGLLPRPSSPRCSTTCYTDSSTSSTSRSHGTPAYTPPYTTRSPEAYSQAATNSAPHPKRRRVSTATGCIRADTGPAPCSSAWDSSPKWPKRRVARSSRSPMRGWRVAPTLTRFS